MTPTSIETFEDAPLVAVVGPTGSGKSEIGLALAEKFPAEIVNCDSVQIYRHLNIGTAKLPVSEQRGIPHRMLDVVDPDAVYTAGAYSRQARAVLRQVTDSNRLPIVVGGTGFYLRALLDGLFEGPTRDDELRRRLEDRERKRPGSLHRILTRLDKASAIRIHPRDVQKLIRTLEVILLTKQPLSQLHEQGRDSLAGYRTLKIGLDPPRDELNERLDLRSRRMFQDGLLDEVRHILALGFPENSKALESLGYCQALRVLRGEATEDEAIEMTQRETRRYAKRQRTWFRRDTEIVWLGGFGREASTQLEAIERVRLFIESNRNSLP